jgi:type I restriction enzyme, S subunit
MTAVLLAEGPSARYLVNTQPALLRGFDPFSTAPGSVERFRQLILSAAVRGLIVDQSPRDEPATALVHAIRERKLILSEAGLIKRDKPCRAVSDEELPYALPMGWERVRLRELLTKIGAGSTPLGGRDVYTTTGVKFLRSQNVWNHGLALDDVACIPPIVHEKMSGTKVLAGDLLFNITGASIGRCALVPDNFDEGNVSQHVTIIRPALPSIRQFLHLVLISDRVQQTVMDVQVGVSREGLSIAKLGEFVIPLPPVAEQHRIVARVEELMKLCDALEQSGRLADEQHARLTSTLFDALAASESAHALAENWQRVAEHFDLLLDRPEAIDALEKTILQLAVRGALVPQKASDEPASELLERIAANRRDLSGHRVVPELTKKLDEATCPFAVPSGWAWATWETVALQIGDIDHKMPHEVADGVPYISPRDFTERNGIDFAKAKKITETDYEDLASKIRPERGDLIYPRYGTIGKVRLVETDLRFLASYSCAIIKCLKGFVDPDYQFIVSISALTVDQATTATNKTTQPNVGLKSIKSFLFPLPPLAEQRRIVARVEELRRLCAQLRERLTDARRTQSHLADALVAEVAA